MCPTEDQLRQLLADHLLEVVRLAEALPVRCSPTDVVRELGHRPEWTPQRYFAKTIALMAGAQVPELDEDNSFTAETAEDAENDGAGQEAEDNNGSTAETAEDAERGRAEP